MAAFHLEKLAELGLLEVEYRRPPGRTGPGAGRPAKLYRRAGTEIALSVPERQYDVAALLLADAVEAAADGSVPVVDALRAVARDVRVGDRYTPALDQAASHSRRVGQLTRLLAEHGYEPHPAGKTITLRNCPFHALAEEHRELVCGMNLELLRGAVVAAGLREDVARQDPARGRCCVSLHLTARGWRGDAAEPA